MVGVRIGAGHRVHYFDSAGLDLAVRDRVEVETEQGTQEAQVVIAPAQVLYSDLKGPLRPVLRAVEI